MYSWEKTVDKALRSESDMTEHLSVLDPRLN